LEVHRERQYAPAGSVSTLASTRIDLGQIRRIDATMAAMRGLSQGYGLGVSGGTMAVKRILVVEDEFLIALDIVAALEAGGSVAAGRLPSIDEALDALEGGEIDGALLDANLGGHSVGPLADALAARGL